MVIESFGFVTMYQIRIHDNKKIYSRIENADIAQDKESLKEYENPSINDLAR